MRKLTLIAMSLIANLSLAQPVPLSLAVADHRYLKLTGGTLTNLLTVNNLTITGTCTGCTTGAVPTTRLISTTAPLSGGGDLSADRTFTCTTCATSANTLAFFSATSSAQLAALLGDETGTGPTVFGTSPNITTPTGIVKGDVGLGNVDNTSDATKNAASVTLTNKTIDLTNNTLTATSLQLKTALTDETGSGPAVFSTSPTLVTPALGVATATALNGNVFTTGTYTLTGAAAKTLTFSNTLTLAGTDSTTMTFPSTSATVARTDAANTFTGHQTVEGVTSTGATGAGKLVFDTSPTLVTPALGTPASGVMTNVTGTAASLTAGTATNANNTAVIDDTTTNATMFPTWVTTASGNQAQKTSSTLLTFNPSTGNFGIGGSPSGTTGFRLLVDLDGNQVTKVSAQNSSAGTGAAANINATSDTSGVNISAFSSTYSGTLAGINLAGSASVNNAGTGTVGMTIGSTSAAPVILMTGATRAATISASSQAVSIRGTQTNDNATAGDSGEYQTGTVAANTTSLSTGTTINVGTNTNITLTAGDWDCTGVVNFTFGATTSVTNLTGGISTTTGALPAQDSYFDYETAAMVPTGTAVATWVVPTVRLSNSGSTNVFLVAQGTFTLSTIKVGGTIRCRRMR